MENSDKKIENISSNYKIKESDKREGIKIYGGEPLGENEEVEIGIPKPTAKEIRRREEILQRIALLEKSLKSSNYVEDKNLIEKEIIELENELRKNPSDRKISDGKVKTAKELAMEGKIAWDKGDEIGGETSQKRENNPVPRAGKFEVLELNFNDNTETPKVEGENKKEEDIPISILPDGTIEGKEKHSREELLNAAEIFCKYNRAAYYKDPTERKIAEERALLELKDKHSEREIEASIKVAAKRNEMFELKDRISRVKQEYKSAMDNPSAEISTVRAKYDQQIENIKREMRLIDNDYIPLLRDLKVANLDNQLKNLEKYRDHTDFKEKVQDAELFALSMIQTEMVRYQDAKVSSNSVINPKGWDHVKNFFKRRVEGLSKNKLFQGYMKMGRGKRMALNAAMIGAGTALWLPASVAAGASTVAFVGYKMARSVMGGTFGYYLSKKVFQPIARIAYEHDDKKMREKQQSEAINSEEMAHFEQLARNETNLTEREKILQKIADFNIELCDQYTDKIRRNKRWFMANNALGTVAAGLIGGKGAQLTADWLAGPGMFGIFGTSHGTVINKEAVPDNNPKGGGTVVPGENGPKGGVVPVPGEENMPKGGGVMPGIDSVPKPAGPVINQETLNMATVRNGEGVEHVLRRQLEANPGKFGFKGDMTNKAAVHEWSGGKAEVIAVDQKYRMGNTESWVRDMGPKGPEGNPAYVLDLDASGKPSIHEYFEGKASGTGGLNSPYEYSHNSPISSQRYISAIDNTPEQVTNTNSGGIKAEFVDTSKIQGQPASKVAATPSSEIISSSKPTISSLEQTRHISDVYEKNIEHLFPENTMGNWTDLRTLSASQIFGLKEPGRLLGLTNYLHKLEEVTGLNPTEGTWLKSSENVFHYVNRAIQKASELGRLEEVILK
jgi:hypothetical protein